MTKFVRKVILFLLGLLLFGCVLSATGLYERRVPGSDVYRSIDRSRQRTSARTVILGDSVGRQFFSSQDYSGAVFSLTCNQAIGVVGHYILLENVLRANDSVETVFLVYSPFSFQDNLNQKYTYNYFLKPFFKAENMSVFTPTVIEQVKKIPYSGQAQWLPVRLTSWTPEFTATKSYALSPISIEYLRKMKELTADRKIDLRIIPGPAKASRRAEVVALMQAISRHPDLEELFDGYEASLKILPDDQFVDGHHLRDATDMKAYMRSLIAPPQ